MWLRRFEQTVTFAFGSACLLGAMAVNFAGVVGRAFGWNPLGLVEVVQLFVVGAIASAMVIATREGAHAAVRMLIDRLPARAKAGLQLISELSGGVFFAALAFASAWLLADTWPGDERSDVLGLPIAPERIVCTVALAWVAILFFAGAVNTDPGGPVEPHDA